MGQSSDREAENMSDLLAIFDQYGVDYCTEGNKHVRNGWVGLPCPECGSQKYHYGIELSTFRSNCWLCSFHDTAKAISVLCQISLNEAVAIVRGNGTSRGYVQRERTGGRLILPKTGELLPAHRNYLEGRGFDPDEIKRLWGIAGIGPEGKELRWRIFIPIHDTHGRVVSWTTRAISKSAGLRYISASEEQESVPHKSLLYGSHLARHTIIIHEGPIDVWSTGPGSIATFGLGFSAAQMAAMAAYPQRVVCFDSQPDAQKRAIKLCRDLSALPGITENVYLDSGKDAAEADKSEILELRARYL